MRFLLRLLSLAALLGAARPLPAAAQALTFSQAVVCGCSDVNARPSGPSDLAFDAQGNVYVTGSFAGTITVGGTTLTSAGEVDAYVVKINPQGQYLWAVRGGGDGRDVASALALDGTGHVLITGYFDSRTAAFGTTTLANSIPNPGPYGGANLLVARLDAATGTWQWAVGGTGNMGGTRIGADAQGGVYVGGGVAGATASLGPFALNNAPDRGGDIVLAKLSGAAGTWQWAVRGGGAGAESLGQMVVDGTGHVYAAGGFSAYGGSVSTFGPTILSNPQGRDTFVIRLDAGTGAWQWAVQPDPTRTAAQDGGFSLQQMLVDRQGRLFLVGTMNSQSVRFGPTTLTTHSVAKPLGPLPNTAIYYYNDVVVAQLDAGTGAWGWAVNAGGLGDDQATTFWLDRAGRPTLNGGFSDAPPAPGLPPVQGSQFGATTLASANGTGFLARLDPATGAWQDVDQAPTQLAFFGPWSDPAGNLYGMAGFGGTSASVGGRTLTAWGTCSSSYYVGRLGGTLLPVGEPTGTPVVALYPNPSAGMATVTGLAAGQAVQVRDVLGRLVLTGVVPPTGRLELALPLGRTPGLYLVRAGSLIRRWLVE